MPVGQSQDVDAGGGDQSCEACALQVLTPLSTGLPADIFFQETLTMPGSP